MIMTNMTDEELERHLPVYMTDEELERHLLPAYEEVVVPFNFWPSPELQAVSEAYERFYATSIAQPYDAEANWAAYLEWSDRMRELGLTRDIGGEK